MKIGRVEIRAGQGGYIRVSRPHVDVLGVSDDSSPELLFSVSRQPLSIVMAGRVFCPANSAVVVVYPYELPARPIVDVQTSFTNDTVRLPYHQLSGAYVRVQVQPTLTQVTFTCDSDRFVNYVVVARNG